MKKTAVIWLCLSISACDSSPSTESRQRMPEIRSAPPPSEEARICKALNELSSGGQASFVTPLISDSRGQVYVGRNISLVQLEGRVYLSSTEMINGRCWAEAAAFTNGNRLDGKLHWRCPVNLVSKSITKPGALVVESINEKECDFGQEANSKLAPLASGVTQIVGE